MRRTSIERSTGAVRVPGLTAAEAQRAELRLDAAARDCGCGTGSVATSIAALGCAIYLWASLGSPLRAGASDLVVVGVVVLAAGLAGKLAGIAMARRRLRRELHRLHELGYRPITRTAR